MARQKKVDDRKRYKYKFQDPIEQEKQAKDIEKMMAFAGGAGGGLKVVEQLPQIVKAIAKSPALIGKIPELAKMLGKLPGRAGESIVKNVPGAAKFMSMFRKIPKSIQQSAAGGSAGGGYTIADSLAREGELPSGTQVLTGVASGAVAPQVIKGLGLLGHLPGLVGRTVSGVSAPVAKTLVKNNSLFKKLGADLEGMNPAKVTARSQRILNRSAKNLQQTLNKQDKKLDSYLRGKPPIKVDVQGHTDRAYTGIELRRLKTKYQKEADYTFSKEKNRYVAGNEEAAAKANKLNDYLKGIDGRVESMNASISKVVKVKGHVNSIRGTKNTAHDFFEDPHTGMDGVRQDVDNLMSKPKVKLNRNQKVPSIQEEGYLAQGVKGAYGTPTGGPRSGALRKFTQAILPVSERLTAPAERLTNFMGKHSIQSGVPIGAAGAAVGAKPLAESVNKNMPVQDEWEQFEVVGKTPVDEWEQFEIVEPAKVKK